MAAFLVALWFSFLRFIRSLFRNSPSATLPNPVTARSPVPAPAKATPTPPPRSPSTTPRRVPTDPEHVFHPPTSPLASISLSGIFATSPSFSLASRHERQALAHTVSPTFPGSTGSPTPSFHTLHSRPSWTPRTPSSAVIVRLDRSEISPITMSDGSLEVISLGHRRGVPRSPAKVADMGHLPSPWSPTGRLTPSDVWMSVDGTLVSATGPVDDNPARSQDDSLALILSSLTLSRISTSLLYSPPSALDVLGISAFVHLGVGDRLSKQGNRDDPASVPKLNQVRDGNHPTPLTQDPQTPPKRRQTLPSITRSRSSGRNSRAVKCVSTPLTKLDNVNISHVQSVASISSMAYRLRLGLFAEGRSMTAIENIISLLDQANTGSTPPHADSMQLVEIV